LLPSLLARARTRDFYYNPIAMTTASAATTPIVKDATDAPSAIPADLAPVVSLSRVEANRRNALRSTGPKTPEGRAQSSKNARKHGLLCSVTVIGDEKRSVYRALRRRLWDALQPAGPLEELLFDRVVSCAWRLRRATYIDSLLIETERIQPSRHEGSDLYASNVFRRTDATMEVVSRYEAAIERSLFRALDRLLESQSRTSSSPT